LLSVIPNPDCHPRLSDAQHREGKGIQVERKVPVFVAPPGSPFLARNCALAGDDNWGWVTRIALGFHPATRQADPGAAVFVLCGEIWLWQRIVRAA
jgi:hypothetical protein